MPEGPEVRVVADAVAKAKNLIFEGASIIENVPGAVHRYSRELPNNWSVISQHRWQLKNVRTKGKLIIFDIEMCESKEPWVLLTTLGMSGDYRFNSSGHKHCRFSFLRANGGDLSFIDARCFGTLRVVTPEEARKLEAKVGWDLLQAPMDKNRWQEIQKHSKIKDQEIKVALLDQSLFSGLGNIYVAETLYEVGIDPRRIVSKIDADKWAEINLTAHTILQKAYALNGSSVKDYTFDGKKGNAQTILKVYGRKHCPKGHQVQSFEQEGRTTWWVPEIQKH